MSQQIIERISNEMRVEGCWDPLDPQTRLNESHRRLRLAKAIGLLAATGSADAGGDVFEAKATLEEAGHDVGHAGHHPLSGTVPDAVLPVWKVDGELLLNKKELVAYAAAKANGNGSVPAGDTTGDTTAGEEPAAEAARPGELLLSTIRTDGGTQARAGLDEETVADYAAAMQAGDTFPAVVLYYDGEEYWLADGFHRVAAARRNDDDAIAADVRQGTRRDAVLHAAGANANHGLRRSNDDKRRAVVTLLQDEEWGQWSDREIARRCNVSHPFVAKVRGELSGNVSRYDAPRKVERGGKVYEMETAAINAGREEEDGREPVPIPRPLPEPRVVETSRDFVKRVENSYSGHLIGDKQKIRRPVEYEGALYVSQSGAMATRLVPVEEWPGRPITTHAEAREQSLDYCGNTGGPHYYHGWKVAYGQTEYVLDEGVKIRFVAKKPAAVDIGDGDQVTPAGNVTTGTPNWTPIRRLEGNVQRYLKEELGYKTPKELLEALTNWLPDNVGGALERLEESGYLEEPYRKGDLRQAINNLREQQRQKARRAAVPAAPEEPITHEIDDFRFFRQLVNTYSPAANKTGRIADPVRHQGNLYLSVGDGSGPDGRWANAYRLVPAGEFDGPTEPFQQAYYRTGSTDERYHGAVVATEDGKEYAFVAPGETFVLSEQGEAQRRRVQQEEELDAHLEAKKETEGDLPAPHAHRAFPAVCPISGMHRTDRRLSTYPDPVKHLDEAVHPSRALCDGCPNHHYTTRGSWQCGHPSHYRALESVLEPTYYGQLLSLSAGEPPAKTLVRLIREAAGA